MRCICRKWVCGHMGGREGGMNWEMRIEICTFSMWEIDSGNLKNSKLSSVLSG